ncbi:hypothetical protein Taro_045897 [Colocasia esculenta]|uniref:Uncharacterized protein n=1 Tax=Colocasia esculenta TaxID=4460 RepID=A0A843X154_COLES|nr:hypothetical protein [Colocasia esculenta]
MMGDAYLVDGFPWVWRGLVLLLVGWVAMQVVRAVRWVWWTPRRLERALREQGIDGKPYRFLFGDIGESTRLTNEAKLKPMRSSSHDITPRVAPLQHLTMIAHEGACELDVWPELQNFTRDVISRTAFGSSYEEGRRIFQLQEEIIEIAIQSLKILSVPGYRYLPTKRNQRLREIAKEVDGLLREIVMKREKALQSAGNASTDDLLSLLLESNLTHFQVNGCSKQFKMTTKDVIEECKLFYFAGQETTSVLLTWAMVVLSMHTDWQDRARSEVLQVFGRNRPDYDGLSQLKTVTMILYEVLRLYPPATLLVRSTNKTMKLGEYTFPPGVHFILPILFIHHDPEFWGEDANEFNPERFANGVSKASKNQVAFFPFGGGPRVCIGQSFAMTEAKMGLATILQHFSFELSPAYAHAPCTVATLHPQHGAQLVLRKL